LQYAMRFAIKHAVAGSVVIGGIVGLTAASYIALLAWAILAGGDLGGPLAFPFLVLFAVVASVVSVGLILLPTTALTEWICVTRNLRLALQIPIATVCLWTYLISAALVVALLRGTPLSSATFTASVVFVLLLAPLGAYWWSMQSADWLLGTVTKWWNSIRYTHD